MLPTSEIRTQFDIAVLGGGIAGLLIASELSKRHDVVVIEEKAQVPKTKYWLTDKTSAERNPQLSECIDSTYRSLDFIACDTTTFRCQGTYVLWNTERLIELLTSTIKDNGGEILLRHTFYGFRQQQDSLLIFTNDHSYKVVLAVDCLGFGSPTIYAKGIVDIFGYYLLYGGTYPAVSSCDPVGLHNLRLDSHPSYVEAFPTADGKVHLVLILPVPAKGKPTDLRTFFTFILNRSPYSRLLDHPATPEGFLGGVIPVGNIRKPSLDRMFFFGEAGQYNPAAGATALTRMLYTYRQTAQRLSQCLDKGKVAASDLATARVPPISRFNRRLQLALFRDILTWNSDYFTHVINELKRTNDSELVDELIFGSASAKGLFSKKRLARLWFAKSTFLLKALVRGLLPLRT